jgi:hypothetical protein
MNRIYCSFFFFFLLSSFFVVTFTEYSLSREVAKQLVTPSEVTVEDVKGMIDALTATMNAKIKSGKGVKPSKKRT